MFKKISFFFFLSVVLLLAVSSRAEDWYLHSVINCDPANATYKYHYGLPTGVVKFVNTSYPTYDDNWVQVSDGDTGDHNLYGTDMEYIFDNFSGTLREFAVNGRWGQVTVYSGTPLPPPGGNLIVINGSGSGDYPLATVVPIVYVPSAVGKRFVSWDPFTGVADPTLSSSSITILEIMQFPHTVSAIEEDIPSDEGDGYHVWVDNFSELASIITSPIVGALSALGVSISQSIEDNTAEIMGGIGTILDGISQLGTELQIANTYLDDLNMRIQDLNLDMTDGFSSVVDGVNTASALNHADLGIVNQNLDVVNQNLSDIKGQIDLTNSTLSEISAKLSIKGASAPVGGFDITSGEVNSQAWKDTVDESTTSGNYTTQFGVINALFATSAFKPSVLFPFLSNSYSSTPEYNVNVPFSALGFGLVDKQLIFTGEAFNAIRIIIRTFFLFILTFYAFRVIVKQLYWFVH